MYKIKALLKEKVTIIIIFFIILVCSIAISIGVYTQVKSNSIKTLKNDEQEANYDNLKNNFESLFTNSVNREATAKINIDYNKLIYTKSDIDKEEKGKYTIKAKIPNFKSESNELKKINKEINNIFKKEISEIIDKSQEYTTFNLDYVAYINNDIISLAILCKYKKRNKPSKKNCSML